MNKSFWVGVLIGVGGTWAYHAFIKKLPAKGQG